jgi:hypothetical protein
MRSSRYFLPVAAACLALAACDKSVTLNTAAGQTPIYTPPGSPAPSGQMAAPPAPGDRSGTYAGTAVPLDTGGGMCITNQKVSGFIVRGRSVRYQSYRGTLDANGGVQMVAGQNWIVGQFEGPVFSGQLDTTERGRSMGRGCSYLLTLQRTGP